MAEVFTAENIRVALLGLAVVLAGCALADRVLNRRVGWLEATLLVVAGLVIGDATATFTDPTSSEIVATLAMGGLAAWGAVLLARASLDGALLGALVAVTGVFVGVPETDPVIAAAGLVAGFAVARLARFGLEPSALVPIVAAIAWVALIGSVGDTFPLAGGLAALGLAPAWPVGQLLRRVAKLHIGLPFGKWLLAIHAGLSVAAGRLVAAADAPTWGAVGVIAGVGVITAVATRVPARARP